MLLVSMSVFSGYHDKYLWGMCPVNYKQGLGNITSTDVGEPLICCGEEQVVSGSYGKRTCGPNKEPAVRQCSELAFVKRCGKTMLKLKTSW